MVRRVRWRFSLNGNETIPSVFSDGVWMEWAKFKRIIPKSFRKFMRDDTMQVQKARELSTTTPCPQNTNNELRSEGIR